MGEVGLKLSREGEYKYDLMEEHEAALPADDLAIFRVMQERGDIDVLLGWYLGRVLLPAIKPIVYFPHPNIFILGSWASGKTTNVAKMAAAKCMTTSYYKFVNVAPVGRQADLMYRFLYRMTVGNDRIEHLIEKRVGSPRPLIRFWNGSTMEFLTVKPEYLTYLEGEEFDWGNIEEAANLINFSDVLSTLGSRLRGIRERTNVTRDNKLTITSVPGDDDDLLRFFELGLKGNPDHLSIKLKVREHNLVLSDLDPDDPKQGHVTEEQIRVMLGRLLPEDIPVYIDCEWPSVTGRIIPASHYDACESIEMEIWMDDMIQSQVIGAVREEDERLGIVRWEMPHEHGHSYLTIGDPGTGNPPKRNAGVVMVWDTTDIPAQLVYFHWVFGFGSISPWVASFKYAKEKYPGPCGFDTTSTQKYMDELVFEQEGIIVHPLNFSRDKNGFLNALRFLLERKGMSFPFIFGMKSQSRKYKLPDKHLAQDIIATLMMSAWMIRPSMAGQDPEQDGLPDLWPSRGYRGRAAVGRRIR